MYAIKANRLTKKYLDRARSYLSGDRGMEAAPAFTALSEVSFEIKEGERVGLIGRNGAGKTTLLQILTGFSRQTSGGLEIQGNIHAILDMGTGLEAEQTGRENIYTSGALYGKSREEIDAMLPELIEFIDIGDYFDRPVRTYSSGMAARLAFSVISFIEPEILIIDEILGVGDAHFAQKSQRMITELCDKGKILILVSHSMETIRAFTDRCIWLEKGALRMDGSAEDVTAAYMRSVREELEIKLREDFEIRRRLSAVSKGISIDEFVFSTDGRRGVIFDLFDDLAIDIALEAQDNFEALDIELAFYTMDGVLIALNRLSEDADGGFSVNAGVRKSVCVKWERCGLTDNTYEVICKVRGGGTVLAQSAQILKMVNNKIRYLSKPEYSCDYNLIMRAEEGL